MSRSYQLHPRRLALFLGLPVLLAGTPFSSSQPQKKSGKSPGQAKIVRTLLFPKIDPDVDADQLVTEDAIIQIEDNDIEVHFDTLKLDDVWHATKVWTRNYRRVLSDAEIDDLPEVPRCAPDKTVPESSNSTREWKTYEKATLHPTGSNNNTLVIWAYYKLNNHVRYYRSVYRYQAELATGFTVVAFDDKEVRAGGKHESKKINRLDVFTTRLKGRQASKVFMRVVPNKIIPHNKTPRFLPKDAKPALGFVQFNKKTRLWTFLQPLAAGPKGKLAPVNTIQLWALYYSRDGVEIRRFSCSTAIVSKKK